MRVREIVGVKFMEGLGMAIGGVGGYMGWYGVVE